MRLAALGALGLALIAVSPAGGAAERGLVVSADVTSDALWEGEVEVAAMVTVAGEATLTILPGTKVRFARDAGLVVRGILAAAGTEDDRILFVSALPEPSPGAWKGIRFTGSGEGSVLSRCTVSGAEAIVIEDASPSIRNCEVTGGTKGLTIMRASAPAVEGNLIRGMQEGGIESILDARPRIEGNTVEECGPFGIASGQDSLPVIRNNVVRKCDTGIGVMQSAMAVEGNTLEGNKIGAAIDGAPPNLAVRGNTFSGNDLGIVCRRFSSPAVEDNRVTGSEEGIVCFMGSSPAIRFNEVRGNKKGISCLQISNPLITGNDIRDNGSGVYLHLSSYAIINGNNFSENVLHIELDNMSSDWEIRVGKKPVRGRQARNQTRVQRGMEMPVQVPEDAEWAGVVDATGNWWGEETTAEMEAKGPEANITALKDYYDVPTLIYEGYEGEYVQDRIDYSGWLGSRIAAAGPRQGSREEKEGVSVQ